MLPYVEGKGARRLSRRLAGKLWVSSVHKRKAERKGMLRSTLPVGDRLLAAARTSGYRATVSAARPMKEWKANSTAVHPEN